MEAGVRLPKHTQHSSVTRAAERGLRRLRGCSLCVPLCGKPKRALSRAWQRERDEDRLVEELEAIDSGEYALQPPVFGQTAFEEARVDSGGTRRSRSQAGGWARKMAEKRKAASEAATSSSSARIPASNCRG